MQLGAVTTPNTASTDPRGGVGGVRGAIGDMIRGAGAGIAAATNASAVVSDKATLYPFEGITSVTGLLKEKTANVKGVSAATSLLNTVAGFGALIAFSTVSGGLRAPGTTAFDIASHAADLIDGKKTAEGWSLGWGVRPDPQSGDLVAEQSDIGAIFSAGAAPVSQA